VNQRNELIDGWHRWTAHKKAEAATIRAIVTTTDSDAHLLELAIDRNAKHGLQLSQNDKRDMARKIYNMTPEGDRDATKKRLAVVLSVPERTIRDWLSRIDKDTKEARKKRIFELWLGCHTQEEIAKAVALPQQTVSGLLPDLAELPDSVKPYADHLVDFERPIYNVWKQQEKSAGTSHFGNSDSRWVDNLLLIRNGAAKFWGTAIAR